MRLDCRKNPEHLEVAEKYDIFFRGKPYDRFSGMAFAADEEEGWMDFYLTKDHPDGGKEVVFTRPKPIFTGNSVGFPPSQPIIFRRHGKVEFRPRGV